MIVDGSFFNNTKIKYNKCEISRKNEHKNFDIVLLGLLSL